MLHSQHKNVRNRLNLWLKLGLICTAAHVVALGMLLFVYKDSVIDLALTIRAAQLNNALDVIWVRELPAGARAGQAKKGGASQKQSPAASKNKQKSERPKTALKEVVEKKAPVKKGAKGKSEQAKKNQKKKTEPKKPEPKKIEPKKIEPKKVEPEKKPEVKEAKAIEKPEIKKIEPAPVEHQQVSEIFADQNVNQIDADLEGLNFQVYGSHRELEAMQQFQELQQEMARCWHPPVGIAAHVFCQIAVSYDWDGKLVSMEMVKPSGILMFDVSSRNAVSQMEAPKFVRGKTFTITFKP